LLHHQRVSVRMSTDGKGFLRPCSNNGRFALISVGLNGRGGARKRSFVNANANGKYRPIAVITRVLNNALMTRQMDLDGLEAARQMAALSPETQRRFEKAVDRAWSGSSQVTQGFRAIGVALGSKREPVSSANKRKLFAFAEQLLNHGSSEVMNAIATGMLERIWTAAQTGCFDFREVDPYLGPEARRYLVAWDDFNKTKTAGLSRK
jgi:hypothetical protein